jgi:Ca2+-binding RTX toxin-like protein
VTLNDSAGGAVTMTMEELLGQYAAGSFVFRGTDRADTLFGTAYGDSMYGGLGNDEIRGNAGDDELGGGQGDDTLIGGAGNDRYLLGFSTGRDTVVEDGSAEPLSVHTIQLETGITSELLAGLRVGDDLHVRIDATGDALVIQDFYDQPQSWQDNWLVRDAQGQSVNLTTLLSSAPAPTEDWLAEQKQTYRVQREQAFSAGRQADGFGAIGGTTHRRVEYGFSYGANRTTTRTTLQRMVQGSIAFVQANGSINAGPIRVSSETVTETATIAVAHPVFSSAGSGRGRVSQSAGQTGGTASLPEGAMLWTTKSAFPGQISGHGWLVSAGDVLIPVYGPRIGIPPNDGIDHSGVQTVPANINNPAAYELVGFRVHHGTPGQQEVVHETPVVNPTVVVPISTTVDEAYHVPDAVGGDESNAVIAASSTLVEAGDGNDFVSLRSMPQNSQDLSAFFAGRDWRSGIAADSLVDRFSPSHSQYRYLAAHKPMSARNGEEERLADPAGRLGSFVDAGAGDDQVSGNEAKDTIAGGDGADTIDGGGGSDAYLYTGNESGVDTLADSGTDLVAYLDWFYFSQGILNWDERLLYGGRYRFNNDDRGYAQWEGTRYYAPDEVPGGPRYQYIAPLPVTPPALTRSDTAQLEQLVAKGVLSRDVVKFGPGLTLGDLELQISGGDTLQVRWGNAGFDVEIPTEDFGLGGMDLLSQGGMNSYQIGLGVEIFQFADGSSYSLPQILAIAATTIVGTPGDDVLVGTAGDELIKGLAGDDDISGGQGNDRLQGNAGDDIYRFARGDGADTIYDADAQAGNADTVAFGEDIAPEDVTYARTSSNLVLTVAGGGTVTVQGQFAEATRVEQFAFADGTIWEAATIAAALNRAPVLVAPIADQRVSEYGSFELALPEGMFRDFDAEDILVYEATLADGSALPAWLSFDSETLTFSGIPQPADAGDITLRVSATDGYGVSAADEFALTVGVFGTEDNDFLQGSEYGERLEAYGGNDTVVADDGNDTLAGGTGEFDWLEGGDGDDTYVYEAGDGIDGVSDAGGNDSVRFGDGIMPDDVLVTRDPYGTLFLVAPGAGDRIELYDWFTDEQRKIESVEFADGTVWDAAELESRITTAPATETSDILNLSDGDDVVDGLGGDDQIFGNAGNDIIDGGDGWDYIEGGAGHNLVLGGEGDDSLNPGIGNGRGFYVGGAGRDSIGTSTSGSVVALNAGDGVDFLFSSPADPFALSIGGVSTADITLSMAEGGSAVRIGISADDGLTSYVYAGDPSSWPQGTLQLIGEDIRTYDLNAVVQAFLDARAQDPEITEWSAAATLVDNLLTVSTTEALGGALAWQYATTGDLAALSTADKQGVLQSADFAVSPQSITATPPENHAPVVSATSGELLINESAAAESLFTVSDVDNDVIIQYEFWDDVEGGGYWSVNGVQQAAAQTITVDAGDLGATLYVAGIDPGTEQVWVRANDGNGWSAWKNWNMTSALHIPNAAPEISASSSQTVLFGEAVNAGSLFSVSDADSDPIARYEFWDSTVGNGHFTVDGMEQGVNVAIPVSDLQQVRFAAAGSIGSDLVWVRANDGQEWGDWKSWTMNSSPHATNAAPVVSASDATLLTNEVAAADSLFSASDADSDAITQYEFWDDVNGGGYWRVDGVQQAAAQTISVSASQLADTEYVAGASGGTERVWIRASDGMEWSVWKPWNMTTALHVPNSAPVVSASASQTVLLNDAVDVSSLFGVSDADDDPITQYELWDSTAGNGHFTVNGVEQGVNVAIALSSEDLADTRFVGSGTAGYDLVWARANDGQVWSDWRSWTMQSSPHLTNAAPVVTAANNGLLRNEAVAASSLFSVDDADDDAITQYEFWDDVNGGGRFEIDGVQQVAGQTIAVDAAELDDVRYVGGANAGTERVWVRASDAMAWGQWQSWLMSTEGGMLRGGTGPDTLNGDPDTPVLEGGAGDDTLNASDDNSLLAGGSGDDAMNGGAGDDIIAGGSGDDVIHTGGGHNVVLFNAGGGTDTVWSDTGSSQTVSLGGGIGYDGLTLSKNGDDLILNTGGDDHLVLKDWYAGKNDVDKLQVVLDASGAYDPGSEDPLYNGKVETFDFRGLVNQFDQARAEAPGLTSWAMTNALLAFHLSRSDDEAIGGDLAYWYGKNGAFTGISLQAAQQVIGAPGFGSEAQQLRAFAGLQEGLIKLS